MKNFLIFTFLGFLLVLFYVKGWTLSPLTIFSPDIVEVSSFTVTQIFPYDYGDKNRTIMSNDYDIALSSTTTCSCSTKPQLKKGIYMTFPKEATYRVYGLSCGAGSSTVFKLRDR